MTSTHSPIRILVADDHALFRNGIAALLAQNPQMQLVAEAADGRGALEQYLSTRPDVTLMDLQMNGLDGISAIEAIRGVDADARIIALTTYRSETLLHRAMRAGAYSYLMKSMLVEDLFKTILCVHSGQRHLPQEMVGMLSFGGTPDHLTPREIDVLTLAARGNSNKQIARHLGISDETVKSYMRTLFAKLGAADRTHAVALALRDGIISA